MFDEQLVDFQAGEEFAREVISQLPLDKTDELVAQVEAKSRWLQRALSAEELLSLDEQRARRVLRSAAGVRRRAGEVLRAVGLDELRTSWRELLYGSGSVEERVTGFCRRVGSRWDEGGVVDLAGEALHYVFPDKYWLWTRWVWNPRTQAGALRLVVPDWRMLGAPTPGEVYRRVGEAVAYAEVARESMGLFSRVKRRGSPTGLPSTPDGPRCVAMAITSHECVGKAL